MTNALRPRRDPIRVRLRKVPRPCEADICDRSAKAVVVWMEPGALQSREICPAHLTALRAEVEHRGGGALFFLLDAAPPLEYLARLVEDEIRRRQPPPVVYTQTGVFTGFGTIGFTTTYGPWT